MGWPEMPLGNVAQIVMGQSPPGSTYNSRGEGLPFIQGSAEFGVRYPSPEKWCSEPRKIAEPGDLMISVRAPVGNLNFADQRLAIGRGLAIIRGTDATLTGYLSLALQYAVQELEQKSSGGMFASITKRSLTGVVVPLPPIDVQRRIVDLIEHVDAVTLTAQGIASAGARSRVALRETMLADVDDRVAFPEVATIEAGLVDPTAAEHRDLPHVGVNRIESGNGRLVGVQTAAQDDVTSSKFLFSSDDVVYSKIRPELEKACFPGWRGLASADAYPLRPVAGVPPGYLLEVLLSRDFVGQAVGLSGRTKMPKINRKQLSTITVPQPDPGVAHEIGETLRTVNAVTESARVHSQALAGVRSAILSSLLSGEHEIPESYDRFLDDAELEVA